MRACCLAPCSKRPVFLSVLCLLWTVDGGLWIPPAFAVPERVTVQSALVWRMDGSGDYRLPALEGEATYELPEAISIPGQITSLSIAWAFDGEVRLELSADGGLHYVPVINGVPLASGFVKGNRLKWRARLGPRSHLTEVRMTYTDSTGVAGSFGQSALSGFRFRKPIRIHAAASGDLFNYQWPLAIGESAASPASDVHCEERIRSDFADLRITAADGVTLLPYYVERLAGTSPNRVATVWVKIPQLPTQGLTLYLYYGNPSAQDLSDGRAVFEFFDEFTGSRLDATVWDARPDGQGSVAVSDSQAHLTSTSIRSKAFRLTDGVVEYLATAKTSQDDVRLFIRSDSGTSRPDDTSQVAYASAYGGAEHAIAVGNVVTVNDPKPIAAGTPYGYRVMARGRELVFERYDPAFTERQAAVTFTDSAGLTTGSLGLHSDGAASYAWIRVRKDAALLPQVDRSFDAREEPVEPPVFTNTILAPNGNLSLVDGAREGWYRSPSIPTPFTTRILVPHWTGDAASVEVSANNGLSYTRIPVPGVYAYVSKGDFDRGSQLRYRLTLARSDAQSSSQLEAMTLDHDPGAIIVVSPNGGEALAGGASHRITWSAQGYERIYPLRLDYSLDGGKTYHVIASSTENDGTHPWVLPREAASANALVRVSDVHDPSVSDTSDRVFSILSAHTPERNTPTSAPSSQAQRPPASTEDLGALLEELSTDPDATPYELLIKVTDTSSPDPDKEALSYKAGDIVLIRPAGAEWSEAEKNSFLILQAHLTPEAVAKLMNPLEVPTGEIDKDGQPIMRMTGRRKFTVDVSFFDLKPKPEDKGKPAVLRHLKEKMDLGLFLRERTGVGNSR